MNECTVKARKTIAIDLEVYVCAFACVNFKIEVKCFQPLLNYLINTNN